MILADKIIDLRKKNGWSQEELAEKLGVTRQSISKYEGAQSVPDLDKIIKLSEIFGVTTDYLLRDDAETEEYLPEQEITEKASHKVTLEMAQEYLAITRENAGKVALGVALCILSPITLLLLGAASEVPQYHISENAAAGIGLCVLILLIAIATAIFILCGMKSKKYEFLEKEEIETAYGVQGMAKEQREKYHSTYVMQNVIGITFCICSVIPLFAALAVTENDFIMVCMVCLLLVLVSAGVYFIVLGGTRMSAIDQLLEEGEYTKHKKLVNKKMSAPVTVYWLLATAAYLAYSFVTNAWDRSWIGWPVVGVLFPAYYAVLSNLLVKNTETRNY